MEMGQRQKWISGVGGWRKSNVEPRIGAAVRGPKSMWVRRTIAFRFIRLNHGTIQSKIRACSCLLIVRKAINNWFVDACENILFDALTEYKGEQEIVGKKPRFS